MSKTINRRWWNEPKGKRADAIVATEKDLAAKMKPWHAKFQRFERLYTGVKSDSQPGVGRAHALARGPTNGKKLPPVIYNITKSIIDTKTAKITGTNIRPFAVTDGGSWSQMRRAKRLTKFVDGLFYETEMRTMAPGVYKRSRIIGTAAVKVFERDGRLAIEITDVLELRVDPEDALYGKPRQLMQVRLMHRDVVREMYKKPVSATAITGAQQVQGEKGTTSLADMIEVIEAWHLPSGPDAGDGLHVVCTTGGTLFEEEWTEEDFPFVFLRADERLFGFWGIGDCEDLEGLQHQLDKLNKTIQLSNHLCSIPGYYVRNGSNVPEGEIDNEIGRVVRGDDPQGPMPLETPPVPAGLLQEQNDIITRAYATKGISEAAAASQVPQGITGSGEAQRVYADTQTERFNVEAKDFEQFHIRVAVKLIRLARAIHKRDDKFSVRVPGKKFLETMDWKDISLEDDEFDMQVQPTSNMPKTLAGKMAAVQDMLQGGFIKDAQTEGRRLLDLPDLEADANVALATFDYAENEIDRLLDGKKRRPLIPYADFAVCVDRGQRHWVAAYNAGAPEKVLAELDAWIAQCGAKLQQLTPPAPATPPGGQAGLGQPAAPPTSNLMPVNGPAAA